MTSKTNAPKKVTARKVAAISALSALAATAVALPSIQSATAAKVIKIDGSSTVFPITEGVAENFQKAVKDVRVTVGVSGSGGGFKKFCKGETHISNASRPIKAKEKKACAAAGIKYMEIPVAMDALSVVVNKNNPISNISTADLKKVWGPAAQGKVKSWKQVNSSFPNAPLRLYGPGADSGTFDYFTKVINGKSGASRTDFTASEDDNVLVRGVSRDKGGMGYFGYAYYLANRNKIKALSIDGVAPTAENVLNGKYKPLARPIFIYVSQKAAKSDPAVRSFVQYYLKNAKPFVDRVGYVPMNKARYNASLKEFQSFVK